MSVHHDAAEHLLRQTLAGPLVRAEYNYAPADTFSVPLALEALERIRPTLSDGEEALYMATLDVWSGGGSAHLGDLIRQLDERSFGALMESLVILKGGQLKTSRGIFTLDPEALGPDTLEERDVVLLVEVIDALFAMFDAGREIGGSPLSPDAQSTIRRVRGKLRRMLA